MELLILMVALALWVLQKVLSSSNKEATKRRKKGGLPHPLPGGIRGGNGRTLSPFRIFLGSTPTEIPHVPPLPPQPDLSRRIFNVSRKKSKKRKNR